MVPFVKYTVLRLVVFVAAFAVIGYLGAGLLPALLLAALISGMISYVLLRGPREQLAQVVAQRVEQRLQNPPPPGADEALEDEADDQRRSGPKG